jgi:GT2 family glycosyltransferase
MFDELAPELSVVIVTHGRPALLEKAVSSLRLALEESGVSHEFAIGLNGADDPSRVVLERHGLNENADWYQLVPGHPGGARNQVISRCRGRWIYFADDDITVAPEFFKLFSQTRARFPKARVIGGPNLNPTESTRFQRDSGTVLSSPLGAARCSRRYKRGKTAGRCDDSALILCSLFVDRDLLHDLSFSEKLVCAEENAILSEFALKGIEMIADPELAVWHERRRSLAGFWQQVYKYGRGRGQLVRHRDARWFHFVPSLCLVLFLALVAIKAWPLLIVLCSLYVGLVALDVIRLRLAWSSAALYPATHLAYGFGVLHGALFDDSRLEN